MSGPSEHLSWQELACKDGSPYPIPYRIDGTADELSKVFESIRAMYDEPITILSAYRTYEWNKGIGGAKNSQHKLGRALDLMPPKGITIQRFYDDIRINAKAFGIHGLGRYKTFVHVDIRTIPGIVYWKGAGLKDS